MPKTWIEVSESALRHNIETARRVLSKRTRLCAIAGSDPAMLCCVVKSNAYGHGLLEVAQICAKNRVDWLGVDSIEEGLKLRQNGLKTPIIVLGYTPLANLGLAKANNLSLTVYNPETIEALPAGTKIHIKVETGTNRQGVLPENLVALAQRARERGLIIEGLSTHFANIEDTADSSYAFTQLEKFNQAKNLLVENGFQIPIAHAACSAAIFLYPETHFDMVRLGISLYGLWSIAFTLSQPSPLEGEGKGGGELKPVLTWKTIVAQIKKLPAGTPIGYGLTERLARDSRIAVLPIGYWDGYDRKLSSVGEVLIRGRRCKVIGRVCMNMIMVDVTDVPNVQLEDEAVLIGQQGTEKIAAEELAEKIGTINYEVITRINPLIPRIITT